MKSSENSGQIPPEDRLSKHEKKLISFLAGECSADDLIPLLQDDTQFRNYVQDLAETEKRLSILLAQNKFTSANATEPPTWALEGLRGAVARSESRQRVNKSDSAKAFRYFWRLALGGAALAAVIFVLSGRLEHLSEPQSVALASITDLPVEAFIAQAGEPLVVRGSSPAIYSPSGLTRQRDPILLISPTVNHSELAVQISFPGEPDAPVSKGLWRKGAPAHSLSEITLPRPNFRPGQIVEIRLVADDAVIAEQVFKFADTLDWRKHWTDKAAFSAAAEALTSSPARAGDAFAFLADRSPDALTSEAGLRLQYLTFLRLGDVEASEEIRRQLEKR